MSKFPSNGRDELFSGKQSSSNKGGNETGDSSQQLLRARNELQVELERMKSTAAVVATTSSTISSISSQYSTYKARIASAGRTLKQLRSKLENDERYIYWSYLIFVASAVWIFLKRVKVVAISQWLISRGFTCVGLLSETIPEFSSVTTVATTHKPSEPATSPHPSTTMTTIPADYVTATSYTLTTTPHMASIERPGTTTQFRTTETYRTTTPGVVDKEL